MGVIFPAAIRIGCRAMHEEGVGIRCIFYNTCPDNARFCHDSPLTLKD